MGNISNKGNTGSYNNNIHSQPIYSCLCIILQFGIEVSLRLLHLITLNLKMHNVCECSWMPIKTSLSNHLKFCSHHPEFFFQMGTITHTVPCADIGINTVQVEQAEVKSTAIFLLFSNQYHHQIKCSVNTHNGKDNATMSLHKILYTSNFTPICVSS